MCGIFGWIKFDSTLTRDEIRSGRKAIRTLAHRGPDAEGIWHNERVFIAHRRLSVIDIGERANQPFQSDGAGQILSFNGEIYNYLELRSEMQRWMRFSTHSDTEVLYRALQTWGSSALERLDGMFAGGYHDIKADKHILFRDAVGQKPLYYYRDKKCLIYASELRALLALDQFSWRIDGAEFYRYLANGYYMWDTTPIVGVKKLLPGHALLIEGRQVKLTRWWNSVPGADPLQISADETVPEVLTKLQSACRDVLHSDVPIGVFLSGGVDSSLVHALSRRIAPSLRSYSLGISECDFDESKKASRVARLLATQNHHELVMTSSSIREQFNSVMTGMDEPHADPGYINMFSLARSATSDITVALAGDGADELFCGYLPFKTLGYADLASRVPNALMLLARGASGLLPSSSTYLGLKFKMQSWLNGFPADVRKRFNLWLCTAPQTDFAQLVPRNRLDLSPLGREGFYNYPAALYEEMAGLSSVDKLSYFYQKIFLPEFVCHHTDKASMLSGVEVRSPFLSRPFIEFANRIPASIRLNGNVQKWPLRKALEHLGFPRDLVEQRKQGFTLPLARWQQNGLKEDVLSLCATTDVFDGLVSTSGMKKIIADHLEGRNNFYRLIHALMVFKSWRERYSSLAIVF
jgi:asparagine synthase (glutamine-hydrolysing)